MNMQLVVHQEQSLTIEEWLTIDNTIPQSSLQSGSHLCHLPQSPQPLLWYQSRSSDSHPMFSNRHQILWWVYARYTAEDTGLLWGVARSEGRGVAAFVNLDSRRSTSVCFGPFGLQCQTTSPSVSQIIRPFIEPSFISLISLAILCLFILWCSQFRWKLKNIKSTHVIIDGMI